MDKAIRSEWVAALRSGEYKQGAGVLAANGKYCCLGVLCEIAVKHGVIPEPEWSGDGGTEGYMYGSVFDSSQTVLPTAVAGWAGLDRSTNPQVGSDIGLPLAAINDGDGPADVDSTFDGIANLIEAHL